MMAPCVAEPQQPAKIARIGFLGTTPPSDSPYVARLWSEFFHGLRVHGLIDGHDVVIERIIHLAAESRMPALSPSREWATAGGLMPGV